MYWLIEHKTFTVFIAVTIIVLACVYNFVAVPLQEKTADLRNEQRTIRAQMEKIAKTDVFTSEKSIKNAEEELKAMDARYAELKTRINFRPTADYQITAGIKFDELLVNFQSLLKDVQKRLDQKSAAQNIPIPVKLEFPLANATADTILIYYQKLDMIEQLVNLAMEAKFQQITAYGLTEVDFKEFKDIKETVIKTPLFTKNLVYVKLSGNYASILQFISLIQKSDRFIAVEKVILDNDNKDLDNINSTFVIAGVKLIEAPASK